MYSHVTKSTSNLKSVHSLKSLKIPWYKKPLVQDAFFVDIQRACLYVGFYAIVSVIINWQFQIECMLLIFLLLF